MGLVHSATRCLESPLTPRAGNLKHTPLSGGVLAGETGAGLGQAEKDKQAVEQRPMAEGPQHSSLLGGCQFSFQNMPQNGGLSQNLQSPLDCPTYPHPGCPGWTRVGKGEGKAAKPLGAMLPLVTPACLPKIETVDIWLANSDPNSSVSWVTVGGRKKGKNIDLQN